MMKSNSSVRAASRKMGVPLSSVLAIADSTSVFFWVSEDLFSEGLLPRWRSSEESDILTASSHGRRLMDGFWRGVLGGGDVVNWRG